jgi:prepilin-type processing-associated H-X9-DG protein
VELADSDGNYLDNTPFRAPNKLDFRHLRAANFLMVDGHAASGVFDYWLIADADQGTQNPAGARMVKLILNPTFN